MRQIVALINRDHDDAFIIFSCIASHFYELHVYNEHGYEEIIFRAVLQ